MGCFQGGTNSVHGVEMAYQQYIPLHKVISKPSSTYIEISVQDGGIGVTLIDKGLWKTLQDRLYLMKFKGNQLAYLKVFILAFGFPQLYLQHTLST